MGQKDLKDWNKLRLQHWKLRNDSTSVSNVLNPLEESIDKRCKKSSSKKKNDDCYCQKTPVQPKFDLRPSIREKSCDGDKRGRVRRRSPAISDVEVEEEWLNEKRYTILSDRIEESNSTCRRNLRKDAKLHYHKDAAFVNLVDEAVEEEEEELKVVPLRNEDFENKLKKLNTFRKKNYFDCHSTQNLNSDEMANHQCVHKYVLNDRLMPEPVNCDPFGTSRCVLCNQPNRSKQMITPKERGTVSMRNDDRLTSISLTRDKKGVTQIEIPKNSNRFFELFQTTVDKLKMVRPTNSIALRHQKGVKFT